MTARFNDLALFTMLLGLAAILTIAGVLQVAQGEIPCPLCLLQRVAMFGICFGLVGHFRQGWSTRNIGLGLVWSVTLLVIAVRQVLLDIVARPGHAYVGSTVLGLHMPVWSVVIATMLLAAFAAELAIFDEEALCDAVPWPAMRRVAGWLSLYVVALCLANLVSAVLQCGLGACHTSGYKLL